jgi:transcriptional regulator with XRE-family HTH domain
VTHEGTLLRAMRHASGKTQKQVAKRIGVCMETVLRWEAGHPIKLNDLLAFCEVTGGDPVRFMSDLQMLIAGDQLEVQEGET